MKLMLFRRTEVFSEKQLYNSLH